VVLAPRVQAFFTWVDEQQARVGLLPSNKLTQALAYAAERRAALQVYLGDAQVSIDTNHIERALRPIPLGRKNWLFCWSELGAEHTGIVQSLIVTCRLHGIDPYTYFVDVLQRVGLHPAARVAELTPRQWKQHFAAEPLRSDLHATAP
jgi:transposase